LFRDGDLAVDGSENNMGAPEGVTTANIGTRKSA
jgi:hypothetical protein